jgi:hypothetical protein
MATSNLTTVSDIAENSDATPALWNTRYDIIRDNFTTLDDRTSISVEEYGADPNASAAANKTAIQATIDAAIAAGTSTVVIPRLYPTNTGLVATLPNNRGLNFVGMGFMSGFQAADAGTVLEVDLGTSNFQGSVITNLRFNLGGQNARGILMNGAGQHSVIREVWMHNNAADATQPFITIDADTHGFSMRDVRIKGASTSGDGVEVNANIVTLDAVDVTGVRHCVKVPNATTISGFNVLNCRLDESVAALYVDTAVCLSTNFIHNRCENNSGPHVVFNGFDATTNRIFGVTVADNYFTGMDDSAQDGIELFRVDGVRIERNYFKGTGSVANAVKYTSGVTNVWLASNVVLNVSTSMPGYTIPPLQVDDVTLTQSSTDLTAQVMHPGTFTDANRGAAGTAGRVIYNSDDGQLNIDDGSNWTLPDGTTT